MLARTALARLRAQAARSSARDVAHISRQLAHTYLTSSTATTKLAIAPAVESSRAYATATRTKPQPKAKATTTKKKSSAKKTATRKTAAKKPVKKRAVKKTAKKVAAKKPAVRKSRGLTDRQKALKEKAKVRANIAQLKETALEEPKRLPFTPWQLYLQEVYREAPEGDRTAPEMAKKASATFKNISSSEMERLQNKADENRRRNKEAFAKWLNSHTPQQIWEANKARSSLRRKLVSYKKIKIQDDRLVKAPKSSFIHFYQDQLNNNRGTDTTIQQSGKKAGEDWRALSAGQRQKYDDLAIQDRQRYVKEHKSAYGAEPPKKRPSKAAA